MQRGQIVVGVEAGRHLALRDRMIAAVLHVLLARPQQLDRRARHLLGDQYGLAHIVGLAAAAKSTAVYKAFSAARQAARETGSLMPPKHILNAPTRLMKDIGYGAGYAYDPETEDGFSGQNYFPDGMARRQFYQPKGEGVEAKIKERLERWAELRARKGGA